MTAGQIEQYIFERLGRMALPIDGKVYYQGTRPILEPASSSKRADIIVKVVSGRSGQIERGSCVVNAYIPDIMVASGRTIADINRCNFVGSWLETLPSRLNAMGDVYFSQSDIVLTIAEEQTREHFVSLKMDFKLLNANY